MVNAMMATLKIGVMDEEPMAATKVIGINICIYQKLEKNISG